MREQTGAKTLTRLIYIIVVTLGLWWVDGFISKDGSIGWERNAVRSSKARWVDDHDSQVAIIGSSTSRDWLPPRHLERKLSLPKGSVVDAHINGCHQGCTAAQLRTLRSIRSERPYAKLFYGTNLFQMCEFPHSKRSLQQWLLRPSTIADYADLAWLYALNAQDPLQQIGRFGGMMLSKAYGDTIALRSTWRPRFFGKPSRGKAHRWYRARPIRKSRSPLSCDYSEESTALKLAFTEALLDDARALAQRTYLMLLPDRTVSSTDPEMQARWEKHRAQHQAIARARPWVELIDLTQGEIRHRNQFRDGFHLKKKFMRLQRDLFDARLKALLDIETAEGGATK